MTRAQQLALVAQNRNPEPMRLAVLDRASAGMSYTDIAAALGVSRGIISGVVYRARKAGMTFPKTRALGAPKPDKPRASRVAIVKPAPAPQPAPPADWFPVRLSIMELRDGVCRWPLWGRSAEGGKFYCGLPISGGSVYCAHCHALSIAPQATRSLDKRLGIAKFRWTA